MDEEVKACFAEVEAALKKIRDAADMMDAAGLLYLRAGETAEKAGDIAAGQFSLAWAMNAFARASSERANADLAVARLVSLSDSIVTAIRIYSDSKDKPPVG